MDVYLPIANLSVNGLWIVALGGLTGILSGLFGVGGGFLTTPLLIFYGIPPTVAAASHLNARAHTRKRGKSPETAAWRPPYASESVHVARNGGLAAAVCE